MLGSIEKLSYIKVLLIHLKFFFLKYIEFDLFEKFLFYLIKKKNKTKKKLLSIKIICIKKNNLVELFKLIQILRIVWNFFFAPFVVIVSIRVDLRGVYIRN